MAPFFIRFRNSAPPCAVVTAVQENSLIDVPGAHGRISSE